LCPHPTRLILVWGDWKEVKADLSITILVADDHALVREAFSALLEEKPNLKVIAQAKDGREAVRLARKLRPSMVIMDIAMPGMNGIDAIQEIVARAPAVKVLALSMYSDRRFVAGVLDAGASGYLLKECASEEVIRAIHVVEAGGVYLCPQIARIVVEAYVRRLSAGTDSLICPVLSPRERQTLQLIAEGKTTKEIASILGVSVKTVETHRLRTMKSLNIHSIAGLTKYALREGVTFLDS